MISPVILNSSAAIRLKAEQGFAFWDALLAQTARAAGVTRLLTEDMQDGCTVGALHLENPFKEDFDLAKPSKNFQD